MKLSGESQAELIKYAIIGIGLYWAYSQIKQGVSNTIDLVGNLDLNPFDANGWLGLTVPPATAANPRLSGYDSSHIAAMTRIGLDINKYHVWYPNALTPLEPYPAGTIKIKWGANQEKYTLYAPNAAGRNFQIFTL